MEEPSTTDACSVQIQDGAGDPVTSDSVVAEEESSLPNAPLEDDATDPDTSIGVVAKGVPSQPNATLGKLTIRRRWRDVVDQKVRNSSSAKMLDNATREAVEKLEMSIGDAITALEFDYYVLGVAMLRLIATVGFCVIFALPINAGTPTDTMFAQSNAVTLALAPGRGSISIRDTTVRFHDIDSVDDVYDWLTDTLIPSVYIATDHNGKALPGYQLGRLDLANRVLGGVILEMTPREYKSCSSEFVFLELYPNCTYVDEAAKTTVFLDVNLNAAQAKAIVEGLRTNGTWVNYHSKELAVTIATYSGEVSVFTVSRLKVNFLHTGLFKTEANTTSIPDYRGRTWKKILPVLLVYAAFGLVVRCLENVKPRAPAKKHKTSAEIRKALIKQYLHTAGELCVKFGALPTFAVLWTITITLRFDDKLLELAAPKSLDQEYRDIVAVIDALDDVAAWANAQSIVGTLATLQLGLYTIRQLSFHPQLNVFARTVQHSLYQFRAFFVVFIIIFATFSFMGNFLLGDLVYEFSTATLARESCINMLFGTFELGSIYSIRGSGWFFWGYMIVVSLVLLNMMLAIVMGTYKTMSKEGYQGEISVKLANRISTLHRYLVQYLKAKYRRRAYKTESEDVTAQDHDAVIAYGKVRPPLLLAKLKRMVKKDPSATSAMLNKTLLRSDPFFRSGGISDKEILDTFEFLKEGFVLSEAVTKTKKPTPSQSKASRLTELQRDLAKLMEQVNQELAAM